MNWIASILSGLLKGFLDWWQKERNIELREEAESKAAALEAKLEALDAYLEIQKKIDAGGNSKPPSPKDGDLLGADEWNTKKEH